MTKNFKKPHPANSNFVLALDDQRNYISYSPQTDDRFGITAYLNRLGNSFKDGEETALVVNGIFHILEGDFQEEYAVAANSDNPVAECFKVYRSHLNKRSDWSTDLPL